MSSFNREKLEEWGEEFPSTRYQVERGKRADMEHRVLKAKYSFLPHDLHFKNSFLKS